MSDRTRSRSPLGAGILATLLAVSACAPTPPEAPAPHRGPIVLITFDALRADVVAGLGGEPSLTPNLHRLIGEADWSGRAIAASSWTVPSMASLFTGLQPWEHGAVHPGRARLAEQLTTLPEALRDLGFETAGFFSNHWLEARFGYRQGFDRFRRLGKGYKAGLYLQSLPAGPSFFWAHILPPHAPYRRHEHLIDRLGTPPADLPEQILPRQLEPYLDPEKPLPAAVRERFWALYRLHTAFADEQLGQLLDALRRSGRWDRTLLVVTADHGEEFGETGQIGHGGNLSRVLLEVPLVIKLPRDTEWVLEIPSEQRVGLTRLWATLVEVAGGAAPGRAPGLWRSSAKGPETRAVLSELYLGNGVNRFSAVEEDVQLLWTSTFSEPEPEYFAARVQAIGGKPAEPLSEDPEAVFARLGAAFAATPPLLGRGEPTLSLWSWAGEGTRPLHDESRRRRLAAWLRERWLEADARRREGGSETPLLSPAEEAALRALGYASL